MSIKLALSQAQIAKIHRGQPVQVSASAINNAQGFEFKTLHPANIKKLRTAKRLNRGVRIHLSDAEVAGSGIFDFLKKGWSWLKKNKDVIKPIASAVMDLGSDMVPQLKPARQAIKTTTGWGLDGFSNGSEMTLKQEVPFAVRKTKRKCTKKVCKTGTGILPAGAYMF